MPVQRRILKMVDGSLPEPGWGRFTALVGPAAEEVSAGATPSEVSEPAAATRHATRALYGRTRPPRRLLYRSECPPRLTSGIVGTSPQGQKGLSAA